jgi:hypothetical protein
MGMRHVAHREYHIKITWRSSLADCSLFLSKPAVGSSGISVTEFAGLHKLVTPLRLFRKCIIGSAYQGMLAAEGQAGHSSWLYYHATSSLPDASQT